MERRIGLLVLLMCLVGRCIATPVSTKESVLDKIVFCPSVNFIRNSSYIAECSGISVPTNVTLKNDDLCLCMAVSDIMNQICEYNSKTNVGVESKLTLPSNSKEFDDEVKKIEPTAGDAKNFLENICKDVTNVFDKLNMHSSDIAKPYVQQVKGELLKEDQCGYTCHVSKSKHQNTVKPICMIFFWANEVFSSLKLLSASDTEKLEAPKDEAVPAVESVPKESIVSKKKTVEVVEKASIKKDENQTKKVEVKQEEEQQQQQPKQVEPNSPKTKPADVPQTPESSNTKKSPEKVEEKVKDDSSVPLLPKNDKPAVENAKDQENIGESPNILQSEDNLDELNSAEEHPIKINNDLKDPSAEDPALQMDNLGDQQELPQNGRKFIVQSKEEEESYFFTYFSVISLLCITLYVGYHNKQKILAMLLEGRRSRRGRGSRRRPSTASYRKLDCNLEEAVTSQCNANVTHVIY